ncbi:TonB-dependent receptor [Pseudochryseolinea flava]|nr:TonB-dependent receptor [Pseudochryseolinea flava]
MFLRKLLLLCALLPAIPAFCQDSVYAITDSTFVLEEAVIEGYSYNRNILEVPLAVGSLRSADLQRFNDISFLPAINTIPGARMEERSPGSYRLSLRGSAIRSPFGVRNVKLYWNGLPLTDPGGNTYINVLDFNSVDELEVVKGPGSSIYGAGTGGVLLLKSNAENRNKVEASVTTGSYGLLGYGLKGIAHNGKATVKLLHSHVESDGYREQTAMTRDVFQGLAEIHTDDDRSLSANFIYSDLSYQTPGALTLQQFNIDPTKARPAGGPNPGAIEQKAAIYNQTFYGGIHHRIERKKWSNETGIYGSFTNLKNPAIRNFERRSEQSFGARTNTTYQFKRGRLNFGGEYQHGFSPINVYDNAQGKTAALQSADEITTSTYFAFVQSEFFLPKDFFLTVGGSINKLRIDFVRLSTTPSEKGETDFDPVLSPRIALLKKINQGLSLYTSYSVGFSPPTTQEIYPSTGAFYTDLKPEKGRNIEVGMKGKFFAEKFEADITAYHFTLDNTIVIRRTDDNAEYFENAGNTLQRGLEAKLSWTEKFESSFLTSLKIWSAYTLSHYTFDNYMKDTFENNTKNSIDLSGNMLTGTPPHAVVCGLDVITSLGLYTHITFNYVDELPLDDENRNYANGYKLLGGRFGYKQLWKHFQLDVFGGVDNVLDATYSLGNDLNAIGGRYYNAAPGINFYTGVKTGWIF